MAKLEYAVILKSHNIGDAIKLLMLDACAQSDSLEKAAEMLGLSRYALRRELKKQNLRWDRTAKALCPIVDMVIPNLPRPTLRGRVRG